MSRYIYSIVRCLPDPRTGEFMNVGAIAGDPTTGDWAIRQLSNTERVRRFAGDKALKHALNFVYVLGSEIDQNLEALDEGGEPLGEAWLTKLHHDQRNVVQLSPPAPMVAETAEEALEVIFNHLIIEKPANSSKPIDRWRLYRGLREAYRHAHISDELIRSKPHIYVGERVHYLLDFAVANGHAVQLTQLWSFRRAQLDEVSLQVKAWGYAMEHLRGGDGAQVVDANGQHSSVDQDVDIQVAVVEPETSDQTKVYEEALQVFGSLDADVHPLEDVDAIGRRAAELLRARQSPHS